MKPTEAQDEERLVMEWNGMEWNEAATDKQQEARNLHSYHNKAMLLLKCCFITVSE
jgi:hypothetical protein